MHPSKSTGFWAYKIWRLITDNIASPAINSTANATMADVIGSKLDTHEGNSLYSRVDELYDQFTAERMCYPTLAAGASAVSAAGAWTYGNYVEVIPADTVASDFHILSVVIESCSVAAGVFQLGLYKGAGDELITELRFSIAGGFYGNSYYIVGSGEVDANARIRARLAADIGAATVGISVTYIGHG